ncbi:ranaspumin-like [Mantella aurantiaca]
MYRDPPTDWNSTFSTMKVILLFALFGLSFYQVSGHDECPKPPVIYKPCPVSPVKYGESSNCLTQAMKESADFLKQISKFLCEFKACQEGGNYENYKAAVTELTHTLKCVGCHLDEVLGTDNALERILEEVGKATEGVGPLVIKLVGKLGITEKVLNAVCKLVGKILESTCLQNALKETLPAAINDLTGFYCAGNEYDAKKAANKITTILEESGCALDDALGTEDSMEELLKQVGEFLQPIIGVVLQLTGAFNVRHQYIPECDWESWMAVENVWYDLVISSADKLIQFKFIHNCYNTLDLMPKLAWLRSLVALNVPILLPPFFSCPSESCVLGLLSYTVYGY